MKHDDPSTPPAEGLATLRPDSGELLRSAAAAVADAGKDHLRGDTADRAEQEIRALARFGEGKGLMLDAALVRQALRHLPVKRGMEHEVGLLEWAGRMIKDYDTRLFDEDTFEIFHKPAELPFDYLSDHLLANHLFGDDIGLEGFYQEGKALHVVITQPVVLGKHPSSWKELVETLENQGLRHAAPGGSVGRFWLDGGDAGAILVTDVHEDNVIISRSGVAHPIDVHFKFPSRDARLKALKAFGIF